MPWTIDNALGDELIHIENRNDQMGIYEFRVGALETVVSVQVSRLPGSNEAIYQRSHAIKTPIQATPYRSSRPFWDDVPYALHQAISGITMFYRQAVEAGHEPAETWLVET